jgi:hypothetical protein
LKILLKLPDPSVQSARSRSFYAYFAGDIASSYIVAESEEEGKG